jgi:hypothetical protein
MNIRTLSGFSDWAYVGGCWGKVGVYRIFHHMWQTPFPAEMGHIRFG